MIYIYTKPNCSYCVHAKQFMDENNIQYTEYKLDIDFTRDTIKRLYPSATTYPVIVEEVITETDASLKYIGGFVDLKGKYAKRIEKPKLLDSGEWNGC